MTEPDAAAETAVDATADQSETGAADTGAADTGAAETGAADTTGADTTSGDDVIESGVTDGADETDGGTDAEPTADAYDTKATEDADTSFDAASDVSDAIDATGSDAPDGATDSDAPDGADVADTTDAAEAPPTVAGDTCETATAITTDGTLFGLTLGGFANHYAGGLGCPSILDSAGVDRVFAIDVAPGKELIASMTRSFVSSLALVAGPASNCNGARECVAKDTTTGLVQKVRYRNDWTTTKTIFLIVDGPAGATGTFDLTVTRVDAPPAPDGDVCAKPSSLALSSSVLVVAGSLSGYSKDYATSSASPCKSYSGPERAYAVSIPAGKKLVAKTTPGSGLDTVLNLVLGDDLQCRAVGTVCAAGADAIGSAPDSLTYTNSTSSSQTGFLLVGSYGATPSGFTYSLETQLVTP